jgi:hypothetical protein
MDSIFEPGPFSAPNREVSIKVGKREVNKGDTGDALLNPLAISIRKQLKRGDVLVTSNFTLFYREPFNREDEEMVLGKHRIVVFRNPASLQEIIKKYESSGDFPIQEFFIKIPLELLDETL